MRNAASLTLAVLEAAVPEKDPDVPIVPMLVDVTIPAVADDADELDAPAMTEDHGTEVAGVGEPMDGPPLVLSASVSLSARAIEAVLILVALIMLDEYAAESVLDRYEAGQL